MVAFITSILVTVALIIPFFIMRKRRPVGTPLTWGEAMVAATWCFFLMFWVYGVVPHQWLTMADAEWNWRPDILLYTYDVFGSKPLGFLKPTTACNPDGSGCGWFPMDIHLEHVRDVIAVLIYGIFLILHIAAWAIWQDRGDSAKKSEEKKALPSDFGRPLVRKV